MHKQLEEVRTWCILSFTDAVIAVISPATYSMGTLCQCVSQLCQWAVSVRKGCAQTAGRWMQTTFRKCADNGSECAV